MKIVHQRLLNTKQTASYLGITESALRRRIFQSELTERNGLVRIGSRIFFDKNKLDRFIDKLSDDNNG